MTMINDYIAGAVGGAAGLIVGHPFDTTKVQLQTKQTSSPYKNTWEAMKNIHGQGMAKGFFRGMAFPLASYGLVNSVFFGVYGNTLSFLRGTEERPSSHKEIYAAGCVAGFAQLFVACPVEVVKVVLQSQISKSGVSGEITSQRTFYKGPVHCLREQYQQGGIVACYRGLSVQIFRDVPASITYFAVYEHLKETMTKHGLTDSRGILVNLLAGGTAGSMSWLVIMPLDVVKNTYQARSGAQTVTDCVIEVYRVKGLRGFLTGSSLALIRAFFVNAVTFLAYSKTTDLLNSLQSKDCIF